MGDPEVWLCLLREQDGVVTRAQALAQGLTDDVIRAHIEAGRWQRLFTGVYAVTTGRPTAAMWRRAALLFVSGPAVLSHGTAAAVLGLPGGSETGPIHLTVPYGCSARGCVGIEVHRSRAFPHIVLANCDPPVTSKPVTLVDLAVDAPSAREGMRVLTAGATQAKVPGERIVEALEVRRPRRYRTALLAAARLLVEGVESVLEAWYADDVELAHGLPPGVRQVGRVVEGRRRAEDLEYAMPCGVLTVRLDGWRTHANRRTARVDRARDNAAELEGRARLTFGYEEVKDAPCAVAVLVVARLQQLGWTGQPTRCTRCP
ncbi:type IV toxin-antitoxin system AbiEi family antitoxin domain-containing protein [Actinomycetospora sp. TBRC 11914]|uniref:type IV toxin-antitoxin system AbiEi family antitoxin domain-containing protein n=1 Tax=Actinomycetospora sp. TBRC 11914 TaxID=2729387 RepID=UPI00145CD514|nr:type IV toxin-antitoxin system AbiEi family antitoxin domain-containing protein [Actinomycetospora sp. TBRC 11914]NMO92351.1 type IV toxin-antitoxin system AbiEi family antitoxin domain-containing protein [Actinomycetospora sp. TBRC 11914]